MACEIQTPLMEDGSCGEAAVEKYIDEVLKRYVEAQEFHEGGEGTCWAGMMLEYGLTYLGAGLAEIARSELDEILFDLFPRKVSCDAKVAQEAVRELHAFWRFAKRELGAPGADGCIDLLARPGVAAELERTLADPGNWGMAKSFVMQGRAEGYDMTTEKGMRAWREVYNERMQLAYERRSGGFHEAWQARSVGFDEAARRRAAERKEKRRRKTQRESRRRNRRH
jgi:hypothetical protein